jgi:hypothetical protein
MFAQHISNARNDAKSFGELQIAPRCDEFSNVAMAVVRMPHSWHAAPAAFHGGLPSPMQLTNQKQCKGLWQEVKPESTTSQSQDYFTLNQGKESTKAK